MVETRVMKDRLVALLNLARDILTKLLNGIVFNSEILHILRPFVYVFLVMQHGKKSWVPVQVSLAIDILIIFLVFLKLIGAQKLRTIERRDLQWRCFSSIAKYLLRDPIFDNFTMPLLTNLFRVLRLPQALFGLLLSIINYYRYYIYIS